MMAFLAGLFSMPMLMISGPVTLILLLVLFVISQAILCSLIYALKVRRARAGLPPGTLA